MFPSVSNVGCLFFSKTFVLFRRHVLITGGAGYIGSHTVVELLAASRQGPIEYVPVIVDNLCNSCEGEPRRPKVFPPLIFCSQKSSDGSGGGVDALLLLVGFYLPSAGYSFLSPKVNIHCSSRRSKSKFHKTLESQPVQCAFRTLDRNTQRKQKDTTYRGGTVQCHSHFKRQKLYAWLEGSKPVESKNLKQTLLEVSHLQMETIKYEHCREKNRKNSSHCRHL